MVAKLIQVCCLLHNFCNIFGDDQEDLEEDEAGQIFLQSDPELYEQEKDPEITFSRLRVPNRQLILEQYYP